MNGTQKFKLFINATTEVYPEYDDLYYVYFRSDGTIRVYSKTSFKEYASRGEMGPQGPQGPRGLQGEQGIQGLPGERGEKGDKGSIGEKGPQGDKGMRGDDGEKGEEGDRGPQGLQGERGMQGPIGEMGPRGYKGDRGMQGDSGIVIDDWYDIDQVLAVINNLNGRNPLLSDRLQALDAAQGKVLYDRHVALTHQEYDALSSSGNINSDTFYYIYDDEEPQSGDVYVEDNTVHMIDYATLDENNIITITDKNCVYDAENKTLIITL